MKLLEDVNPKLRKGMIGTVIEPWDKGYVEVEFVREDGRNVSHEGRITFTILESKLQQFQPQKASLRDKDEE